MRINRTFLVIASVAVGAFLAGRFDLVRVNSSALAQEMTGKTTDQDQPEMNPQMMAWMKAGTPGDYHRYLDTLAGEWDAAVTMRMEPEAPWMKSAGTVEREWIFDGRYLKETIDATGEMGEYKALGFMGYNNIDGRYEIVFLDMHSTAIMFETATYDPTTRIMTTRNSMRDPASGKLMHGRGTLNLSNPDRHTFEGYTTGPDGREYKSFEGVLERKK